MAESLIKSSEISLEQQYAKHQNILKDAKKGEVVTRFPPEPFGYLHIGHVKPIMLNYHFSKIYNGKMILRFDDSSPSKETDGSAEVIKDLQSLDIKYSQITYTSDYFDVLINIMTDLLMAGKCYCDNATAQQMMESRRNGTSTPCRDQCIEENMAIWTKMLKGEAVEYRVRGKGDMQALNMCMRDPVLYRCSNEPHQRTGDKYKVYPTYDFSCPILDSIEGVTHCLRPTEYADRAEQYNWIIKICDLRPVTLYEYSTLRFAKTCLAKRKLQWLVDNGKVEGWDDPRFPTVRGLLRRGLQSGALAEYMLQQGLSKADYVQQWDKIWTINQVHIDPIAGRYTAVNKDKICTLILSDCPYTAEPQSVQILIHPKNSAMGTKFQYRCKELYLEYEDVINLQCGEKFTLMKWGNAIIDSIEKQGDRFLVAARLLENDKDFASTKKLTWLPKCDILVPITIVEYADLLTVDKVDEATDFEAVVNTQSKFVCEALAEPSTKDLKKGDIVQFERKGYFIVDKVSKQNEGVKIEVICIPNGKSEAMFSQLTKGEIQEDIHKGVRDD